MRVNRWPRFLAQALREMNTTEFKWGQHDCGLAACKVVEAITGTDPAADIRGTYDTKLHAEEMIESYTGQSGLAGLCEALAGAAGFPEISVKMAGRGDLVMHSGEEMGDVLGVVTMDGMTAQFAGRTGAVLTPVLSCSRAWRVS